MLKPSMLIFRLCENKRDLESGLSDEGVVVISANVELGGVSAGDEVALERTNLWEGRQLRAIFVLVCNIVEAVNL
jgi:hypothetical protein